MDSAKTEGITANSAKPTDMIEVFIFWSLI